MKINIKPYTQDIHRIYFNENELACADTMDDAEILVKELNRLYGTMMLLMFEQIDEIVKEEFKKLGVKPK